MRREHFGHQRLEFLHHVVGDVTAFSFSQAFCRDSRRSIAAAAITPRMSETRGKPAIFPGVSFISPPIECCWNCAGQKQKKTPYCNTRGLLGSARVDHCFSARSDFSVGVKTMLPPTEIREHLLKAGPRTVITKLLRGAPFLEQKASQRQLSGSG